jgi:hypothetical protein
MSRQSHIPLFYLNIWYEEGKRGNGEITVGIHLVVTGAEK